MDVTEDMKIKGGTAIKYCGGEERVVIPDGVEIIWPGLFRNEETMADLRIPGSVRRIPALFLKNGNDSLVSVAIGEGVEEIGGHAFFDCRSLSQVSLPASVTVIGGEAFAGCASLEAIGLPAGIVQILSLIHISNASPIWKSTWSWASA